MTRFPSGPSYRSRSAQRAQIDVQRAAILRKATRVTIPSTWCSVPHRSARIVELGDHVLVIGVLTPKNRERLSQTHVEQHRHLNGVVWFPKEISDAA